MWAFAFYGVAGARTHAAQGAESDALLRDLFTVASALGQVPVVIGGDVNTTVDESDVLGAACASGIWTDLAALSAAVAERAPDPTCLVSAEHPSRIDYLLGNTVALAAFGGCWTEQDAVFPSHRPLRALFDWGRCDQKILQWVRPRQIPHATGNLTGAQEEELATAILESSQQRWDAAHRDWDVEELHTLWASDAVAFLTQRLPEPPEGTPPPVYRGKGERPRLRFTPLAAPEAVSYTHLRAHET